MIEMGARQYLPRIGRFIEIDPRGVAVLGLPV